MDREIMYLKERTRLGKFHFVKTPRRLEDEDKRCKSSEANLWIAEGEEVGDRSTLTVLSFN
jgi:hypothetical protein